MWYQELHQRDPRGRQRGSKDHHHPVDVHFTPDGQQLVVADQGNKRVQVLGLDGSFLRRTPLGGFACAVAVDAVGNIIVTTCSGHAAAQQSGSHSRLVHPMDTVALYCI
jgi:DNA-binding beta-propeller fold protein YncE